MEVVSGAVGKHLHNPSHNNTYLNGGFVRYCRWAPLQHFKQGQIDQWIFCAVLLASPFPNTSKTQNISMEVVGGSVGKTLPNTATDTKYLNQGFVRYCRQAPPPTLKLKPNISIEVLCGTVGKTKYFHGCFVRYCRQAPSKRL